MTSFYKLIYSVKTNNMKFENNEIEKRDEAEDMQNLSPRRDFLKTGIVAAAGLVLPSFSFGQSTLKSTLSATGTSLDNLNKTDNNERNKLTEMNKRKLGTLEVSAIGLGCLPMVGYYGNGVREKDAMITLIQKAYENGVTFFDTAEV